MTQVTDYFYAVKIIEVNGQNPPHLRLDPS